MKQQKHPNFIIIGAMKAATTSVYTYLKQHPDVFMPANKEPMFFNNFQKANNFKVPGRKIKKITTFDQYYALFDAVKNEKAIGEASPSYIFNKDCPQLIRKYLPVFYMPEELIENQFLILKLLLTKKKSAKLKIGARYTTTKGRAIMPNN